MNNSRRTRLVDVVRANSYYYVVKQRARGKRRREFSTPSRKTVASRFALSRRCTRADLLVKRDQLEGLERSAIRVANIAQDARVSKGVRVLRGSRSGFRGNSVSRVPRSGASPRLRGFFASRMKYLPEVANESRSSFMRLRFIASRRLRYIPSRTCAQVRRVKIRRLPKMQASQK